MKRLKLTAIAGLTAVAAVLATQVQAQQTNEAEQTFLTFSAPVEMPGVVLEPGTYEFRLANPVTSRNVVQVFKKDSNEPIGQWTFVDASRPRVSNETVVMFRETREGSTPAVQYWYYPGERIGKEFIYPKDQAERIAARTGQTVRTEDGPVTATASAQPADAPDAAPAASAEARASVQADRERDSQAAAADSTIARQESDADADAARRNAPASSQPTAAAGSTTGNRGVTADSQQARAEASAEIDAPESSVAQSQQSAPVADRDDDARAVGTSGASRADAAQDSGQAQADRPAELPRTASPLVLSGLIGLLSLAGALGVRAIRG
jgi:hypothetical protein